MNNRLLENDEEEFINEAQNSSNLKQQMIPAKDYSFEESDDEFNQGYVRDGQGSKNPDAKSDSRFLWWKMKSDRRSHAVCWVMVLTSGLLITAIGFVCMILLVVYSPTPLDILNGKSPISEKQWKEIVLETFGVLCGFMIGIGAVMSITPLICSCYIMNPKEFQIPGIHDDEEDDGL